MEFITGNMGPLSVVLVTVGVMAFLYGLSRLWVRVPPNECAVFFGRKQKTDSDGSRLAGARFVVGGGSVRIPFLEEVQYLSLNLMSIDLDVRGIPNVDGVAVNVQGIANVKIMSEPLQLTAAAERFLGLPQQEVEKTIKENLLGNLRAIIGEMTIEDLIRDRDAFNSKLLVEAGNDLVKIGVRLDLLKIQDISDDAGYIDALGMPKTAEVMRNAQIAEAQNKSEGDQAAAEADQLARSAEATAETSILDAQRTRDVAAATFNAEINAENARAAQAGPLATAEAQQQVAAAETALAQNEAERKEARLVTEVVKPAEAAREAKVIAAEASRQATVIDSEAEAEKRRQEGQGAADAILAEGNARAEVTRAALQAEADGTKAKLLAEAEGLSEKAAALKRLSEAGAGQSYLLADLVTERMPGILEAAGPLFEHIAEPLSAIESVRIVDIGGDGRGPARFAGNTFGMLSQLTALAEGAGLNLDALKDALLHGHGPETNGAAQEAVVVGAGVESDEGIPDAE